MSIASVKYVDESQTGIRVEYQNGQLAFFDSESSRRAVKTLAVWLENNSIELVSQVDIDAEEAARKESAARRYLKSTNWMVLREFEDPTIPVTDRVKNLRTQARTDANLTA